MLKTDSRDGREGGRGPFITSTSKVVEANIREGILIPFGARLLNKPSILFIVLW